MAKLKQLTSIDDLTLDEKNFNKHTKEGMALLKKSIERNKLGRSVLTDGDVPVCCQRSEEIIGNIMDVDIQQKYADYVVGNFQKCEHPCRLTGANMAISRFDTSEISFI